MDIQTINEYIEKVYEVLLSREPDPEGARAWTAFLERTGNKGFALVLAGFGQSEEYKAKHQNPYYLSNNLETNMEFIFDNLDDNTLNNLFEKTAYYWRTTASAPSEIYWSILTTSTYRNMLPEKIKSQFMKSGLNDVTRLRIICEKAGRDLSRCENYLEYGCGVGRMVVNLPETIREINCVDFSSAHLDEAKQNTITLNTKDRYKFHLLNTLSDIRNLPRNQDIIHSFIVLQHNTPPIIERTVADLLALLSKGGLAVLHIPIASLSYQFNVDEYLQSDGSGKMMEMHILPRSNLYKIALSCRCDIVYSCCAGGCGGDIYSEIIVFRKD